MKTLGERHAHTATNYNNLGVLYRSKGDVAAARSHFAAAHDITSAVLGPDHPDTVTAANNLGLALQAEGRLPEAERVLRAAREVGWRLAGQAVGWVLVFSGMFIHVG